jgi:hypothetical protein
VKRRAELRTGEERRNNKGREELEMRREYKGRGEEDRRVDQTGW